MTDLLEKQRQDRAESNCTAFITYLNKVCKIEECDTNELTKSLARIWSSTK